MGRSSPKIGGLSVSTVKSLAVIVAVLLVAIIAYLVLSPE